MEEVDFNMQTGMFMRENGKRIKQMVLVFINMWMEQDMRDSG